jgi:MATE family multidrug resistance protein
MILAVVGGVVVAGFAGLARPIYALIGHAPAVQVEEVRYFRVLALMSFPGIALPALNAFWSGRGKTRVVMGIELFCAAVNVALNAALISGRWGFPEWGIVGAAVATSVSSLLGLLLGIGLFLTRTNRVCFNTLPRPLLDGVLLRRLIRFGLPNGLQFGLDLLAFNLFVVFVGTYGMVELEAANIAFGLNAMAFIPIIGLGIAVSVLVGQGIGAKDIAYARRAVRSGLGIALIYNVVVVALYVGWPDVVVGLFAREGDPAQAEVLVMAQRCLMYVAAYLMLDAVYIVFGHAVRGAGDTDFSLVAGLVLSWGTLALPTWLALHLGATVWVLWLILVIHVGLAATVFLVRYLGGKWQTMQVIDGEPDTAAAECDLHADRGI